MTKRIPVLIEFYDDWEKMVTAIPLKSREPLIYNTIFSEMKKRKKMTEEDIKEHFKTHALSMDAILEEIEWLWTAGIMDVHYTLPTKGGVQ